MLQFLRKHIIRFISYYIIFYVFSNMLQLNPLENKFNVWAKEQYTVVVASMEKAKDANNFVGKFSKFMLSILPAKTASAEKPVDNK
jgi:hypothetical protein